MTYVNENGLMAKRFRLSTKIMLLGTVITVCFSLSLAWVYIKYKGSLHDSKYLQIKKLVEVTFTLLADYDEKVKKGDLALDKAQKEAMLRVKNLRYNKDDYFWINDLEPKMIMHPYKPEMDGKDQSDYKDPKGKKIFVEFANVRREKGEGYVDYIWPKPGETKPSPKISYVKLFKPWG